MATVTLYYKDGSSASFEARSDVHLTNDIANIDGVMHTDVESLDVTGL